MPDTISPVTDPSGGPASDEQVFDYDDRIAYQRVCPDCDRGLLFAPARFCPACGGHGFLVRWVTK